MIRQFQRRFSAYAGTVPTPVSKLDWLALMQHHGCSTRLVDFSHSFYVAAFFAVEFAAKNAAIWAISKHALAKRIAHFQNREEEGDDEMRNLRHAIFAEAYLGLSDIPAFPTRLAVPVEPEYLHNRLITQQGFFLCPLDLTSSFVANLEASFGLPTEALSKVNELQWPASSNELENYSVLKIILPHKIHGMAAKDLHRMNINAGTLFPGLDGYARSMAIHLREFPS